MSLTVMHPWELDPVEAAPTIHTKLGRGWKLDVKALADVRDIQPGSDLSVAGWLIEAPFAHPLWHSYWLVVVSLAPSPFNPTEPIIHLPGATHELWLYALDPKQPRQDIFRKGIPGVLFPMNFAAQLIDTNAGVMDRLREAVVDILEGRLSPDTDWIQVWATRFGNNMLRS